MYGLRVNIRRLPQTVLHTILLITAFVSAISCSFNNRICQGFEFIVILPLVFIVFGFLVLWQLSRCEASRRNGVITVYIFVLLQWLRLVFLPLFGSLSGYFETYGFNVTEKAAYYSIFLIAWEAIVTFLFCIIVFNNSGHKNDGCMEGDLSGNRWVYFGFILLALVFFIRFGKNRFKFFLIGLSNERLSSVADSNSSAISAIIDYGLLFLVVLIIWWCHKKYIDSGKKRYVYYALVCAGIRLCLISSEGRMSQVYLLGAFLLLLPQLFPEYKSQIIRYIALISIAVIGLMTIYKVFAAFLYDSYIDAVKASSFGLLDMTTQIDIYFYGVKTVARNIDYCNQSNFSIFHSLFDFFRNTFGIHYLFKGSDYTTLEYYNLYLYSGLSTSGHLFSSIAYGYLYLGLILSPLATCFNMAVSFWTEKKLCAIRHMDIYYIVSVMFVRLSFSIFSNFSQSWNVVSRTLIIGMTVIGLSALFKRRARNS